VEAKKGPHGPLEVTDRIAKAAFAFEAGQIARAKGNAGGPTVFLEKFKNRLLVGRFFGKLLHKPATLVKCMVFLVPNRNLVPAVASRQVGQFLCGFVLFTDGERGGHYGRGSGGTHGYHFW
jgi:hypothetical protein